MAVVTDNSSAAFDYNAEPVGDTWRGIGADWFNASGVAEEDWLRQNQLDLYAFERDMYQMEKANEFSAAEAQKQRDFQERMSNTAYQRAMEDMKAAGLNPVLAYQQGGASTPSGASASSSSPSRSGSSYRGQMSDGLSRLVAAVIGGAVTGTALLKGSKMNKIGF